MPTFLTAYLNHFRALGRNARLFLLSNAILNIGTAAIIVLYAIFLDSLGFHTEFQSTLLVVGIAGAGFGLLPALISANRYSARRLLIWSNLSGGAAIALQLVIPQAAVLLITSFFVGASAAIYTVLTLPLLAANSTNAERVHLFSLNATIGLLTAVLGTLLGGFLPEVLRQPAVLHSPVLQLARPLLVSGPALPLQLALLAAGLVTFPCMVPLLLMDDSVLDNGRATATTVITSLPKQSSGWQQRIQTALRQARQWLIPATFQRIARWPGARFVVYQSLIGLGEGIFLTYINLYFVRHLHTTIGLYSVVSSVQSVVLAVVLLGGPILAERMGNVRGPVTAQLLSLPFLVTLVFLTNVPVVIAVYLTRTVLMNIGSPVLQSFIMGVLPSGERNLASSLLNIGSQVTLGLGGFLTGFIIQIWGFAPTFLIGAVCYLAGMLFLVPWFGKEATLLQRENSTPAAPSPLVPPQPLSIHDEWSGA